ncbi:MAG: YncE family protein [Gaiellaceae bacterium]
MPSVDAALATIALTGAAPQGLSLNGDGTRLYVADNGTVTACGTEGPPTPGTTGQVSIVDTQSRTELAAPHTASGHPVYTAVDPGGLAYSSDSGGSTVSIFSGAQLAGSIDVSAGISSPHQLAIDPTNDHMVVANTYDTSGNFLSVIDLGTRQVIAVDEFDGMPHGVSIDSATHRAYVSSVMSGDVAVVDTASGKLLHTFSSTGKLTNINAVDSSRNRLYVSSTGTGSVIGIDLTTEKPVGSVSFGLSPAWGLAVEPWSGLVWAVLPNLDAVSVLDPATWREVARVPLAPHSCPFQVVIDAQRKLAYVTEQSSNSVAVIDVAKVDAAIAATAPAKPAKPARKPLPRRHGLPKPTRKPTPRRHGLPRCAHGQHPTARHHCRP